MSMKALRKELQQLLDEVLDAAPDDETKKRQRPLTHNIFVFFKQLKEQVKVTPEELEAEKRKLGTSNAELSDAKAALEKQKDAAATMAIEAEAMKTVIRQQRSCLGLISVNQVFEALKIAKAVCIHEKLSNQFKSDSQEHLFSKALKHTVDNSDFSQWVQEIGSCIYAELKQGTLTEKDPDLVAAYKSNLKGA